MLVNVLLDDSESSCTEAIADQAAQGLARPLTYRVLLIDALKVALQALIRDFLLLLLLTFTLRPFAALNTTIYAFVIFRKTSFLLKLRKF